MIYLRPVASTACARPGLPPPHPRRKISNTSTTKQCFPDVQKNGISRSTKYENTTRLVSRHSECSRTRSYNRESTYSNCRTDIVVTLRSTSAEDDCNQTMKQKYSKYFRFFSWAERNGDAPVAVEGLNNYSFEQGIDVERKVSFQYSSISSLDGSVISSIPELEWDVTDIGVVSKQYPTLTASDTIDEAPLLPYESSTGMSKDESWELSTSSFHSSSSYYRGRVRLNVRGKLFETYEDTLNMFPDTLLGNKAKRDQYYNQSREEYVFNRNFYIFDAILFYYQSGGILSKPCDITRKDFADEISFFEINEYFDHQHRLEMEILNSKQQQDSSESSILPSGTCKTRVWSTLQFSDRSMLTQLWYVMSFLIIIISIFILCVDDRENNISDKSSYLFALESSVIFLFSLEYLLRIYSAPSASHYILSVIGVVDLVSIIPFYFNLIVDSIFNHSFPSLDLLRLFMLLLRFVRVFKLTRYSDGMQLIIEAMRKSSADLATSFVVVGINTVVFATLIYYVESWLHTESADDDLDSLSQFESIPAAMWYVIITETTVGYGDVYPNTAIGKLLGASCAVTGVILFCLRTPVLVNRLMECYYLRELRNAGNDPERQGIVNELRENLSK